MNEVFDLESFKAMYGHHPIASRLITEVERLQGIIDQHADENAFLRSVVLRMYPHLAECGFATEEIAEIEKLFAPKPQLKAEKMKRTPKYRNQPTVVDGIKFDSKKEAGRYGELKAFQRAGQISGLECQPKFTLQESFRDPRAGITQKGEPKTVRAIKFTADFKYYCERNRRWIVEDVKSPASKTQAYEIRKRLFLRKYPDLDFREV